MQRLAFSKFFSVISFLVLLSNSGFAAPGEFDFSNSVIDLGELRSGGPKKDGIPALNYPKLVSVDEADYLRDSDILVGIVLDGQARAYPIRILNWHEIINDKTDRSSFAVTWCPLTASALVFDRTIKGKVLEFGVSGLLFNSNVAMYDRTSNGLWSQLKMGALSGEYAGYNLSVIPSEISSWKDWKSRNPKTLVLSQNTGHRRNYKRDPYESYHNHSELMVPIRQPKSRIKPKQLVLGVIVHGKAKAYPMELIKTLKKPLQDRIKGHDIVIQPLSGKNAKVTDKDGNILTSVVAYWFAWRRFYLDTLVYE